MSYGLNELSGLSGDAKRIIFANKSKIGRLEERIAVLEGLVQSTSDDRDSYMERCADLEGERDRARRVAVALEQQIDAIQTRVLDLHRLYDRRDAPVPAAPLDAAREAIEGHKMYRPLVPEAVNA